MLSKDFMSEALERHISMTYVVEGRGCGAQMSKKETVTNRVKETLEELRPRLQADGGDIELLGVDQGIVKVKLRGACAGCPMSTMTIKMGVEQYLKKKIPEVVRVEAL